VVAERHLGAVWPLCGAAGEEGAAMGESDGTRDQRDALEREGLNRRQFMVSAGGSALVADAALRRVTGVGVAQAATRPAAGARRSVQLHQGTDLAAAVSPDGRTLLLDVVGVLWSLPMAGGSARRLTSDYFDIGQPDWSPDGRSITFQSYRDGNFNVWTVNPSGHGLRQLTFGPYDHREPRFSPDGRHIAFSSDLSGSYGVYTYELATGKIVTWADTAAEEYEPAWSPDGSKIAFVVANTAATVVIDTIAVVDAAGNRQTVVTVPAGQILHSPAWTRDGKDLIYTLIASGTSTLQRAGTALFTGEEVFPFRVSWLSPTEYVYTADGKARRRSLNGGSAHDIPFVAPVQVTTPGYRKKQRDFDSTARKPVRGIGSPVLSPIGHRIAFRALNDIWTMRIGQRPRPLTKDRRYKSDPAWSPNGRWLSYSSDRAGKLDIWLRDLRTGGDRQLTNLPDAAAVSATWSPDSTMLAFLDQTGAVHTVQMATGNIQQVYPATFEPGKPTWSADGKTLAIAAIKPYSARFREGLSQILLIDRTTGAATYVDPLPYRSLQTRGDDGPVWSPDGRMMAFVIGSVLWVMPVQADGQPAGAPSQLTREVTDAPTWSGDSRELLYLSAGKLRLISADGGRPRTVPVGLSWANAIPKTRTVIHAGRLWDGTSKHVRRDVDVIVDGHRIAAVEPHRAAHSGRLIDASRLMVIPGMIDMHNHREMQGYSYGDRQGRLWLSLGITTTRSPGSPAYHMVEDRESVQSGARIAPRYFATGEAIDGSRIFYNFMRPVVDEEQLALELKRAEALDYDLMKAYVRLPTEWQQKVIDFAHQHRIHATSHYLYPAVGFGGDGMEHIGATNRFGYSRTVTALGTGYQDVSALFDASKAVRTPTLFGSVTLFREDTSLVTDRRVKTLYPSWEYESLMAAVTTAQTTDQTVNRQNLRRQVAQLVAMVQNGGTVMSGTDSPIDHTAVSTHMNLRAMVKYGLTPYEAMVTATRAPGEFLQEPIGTIRKGMLADITILSGDPLRNISDAANVQLVMTNGVLYNVNELLGPFAAAHASAALAPTSRILPPIPGHPSNQGYWWHDPHYLEESKHSCCKG
jgi:Tol biopolymer transport system component